MRVGFNPKIGTIKTDANTTIDRAFLAHFNVPAADAVAADSAGIMALTNQGAAAVVVSSGFTQPAVPRNILIDGSAANADGDVVITGTNFAGEAITETINLNGQTAVAGAKAFRSVTEVELPIQTNTPAKQKATSEVTQGAQGAGSTVFTFLSAATGAAFDVSVAFAVGDDTPTEAAVKLAAGLNANATFAAKWLATPSTANVLIERLTFAAQDATINLTVKTAGVSAITLGAIAVDTTAGVATDQVSIGWGDIFGLPYLLKSAVQVIAKIFNNAVDTGTAVASATVLESNTFDPNGSPDGQKDIDLYIIV